LLEPSRTNLFAGSEYLTGWRTNIGVTPEYNYGVSPEGVKNSIKLQATTSAFNRVEEVLTLSAGVDYTFSMYIKNIDSTQSSVMGTTDSIIYDINWNGAEISSVTTGLNYESFGNGWYRIWETSQSDTSSIYRIYPDIVNGSNSIEIYGLQLEQDATYPTSYIPTYGVSQTRLRDEAPFPATFRFGTLGSGESGTMVVKTIVNGLTDNNRFNFFSNGGSANWYWNGFNLYSQTTGGSRQFNLGSTGSSNLGTEVKLCMRKSGNTLSCFFNGDEKGSIDIGSESIRYFNDFSTYFVSQSVVEFIEFPTALTDSECIALTTIT
jgi:hypothetical protein